MGGLDCLEMSGGCERVERVLYFVQKGEFHTKIYAPTMGKSRLSAVLMGLRHCGQKSANWGALNG